MPTLHIGGADSYVGEAWIGTVAPAFVAHVRTRLRDAAVAELADLATTSARCTAARPRSRPIKATELPCLIVYTNETETEMVSGTRPLRRKVNNCQLVVHGYAKGTGDIDAEMDTIAKEVEAALEADPTLGGLVKDTYLVSTVKDSDPENEQPTWEVILTFTCEFHTREGSPATALA